MVRERFLRPIEIASGYAADKETAQRLLAGAGPALSEWEARPILAAYGIGANSAGALATSAASASAAAEAIGGPVALKVQSPDILHKTEAQAVTLNVQPRDVGAGYERMLANARRHVPDARILGVLVQPMAPSGREVILGIKRDTTFGPLLMVGLGGVAVEVLKDVALAPVPLSTAEAGALVAQLKGAALLEAHRGAPPADVDALVELMVRLGRFAADHAETVAEIDLNPVLVHAKGKGVSVVDALILKG